MAAAPTAPRRARAQAALLSLGWAALQFAAAWLLHGPSSTASSSAAARGGEGGTGGSPRRRSRRAEEEEELLLLSAATGVAGAW